MRQKLYQNTEEDWEKVEETQRMLLFFVGGCITKYQAIENELSSVFDSAMQLPSDMSHELYCVAKSLEDKLRLISTAVIGRSDNLAELWDNLRPRVKRAFDLRNMIAHSTLFFSGRGMTISFDEQTEKIEFAGFHKEHSEFQIEKFSKAAHNRWSYHDLKTVKSEFDDLWLHVAIFVTMLRGEPIPDHWASKWLHPEVARWPRK